MNKRIQKMLISTAVMTSLVGGFVVPAVLPAGSQIVYAADTLKTIPATTTVNITKLQGADFTKEVENQDGTAKSLADLSTALGTQVTGLDGVTFVAYKLPANVTEAQKNALKATKTVDQLLAVARAQNVTLGQGKDLPVTANGGVSVWSVAQADYGEYIVAEKTAPDSVSSAYAVPFFINFPMAASDGSGYLSTVNIYPKNVTGETPKPGKDVAGLANNVGSYKIGDEIQYILKGTIPTNIQDYEVYNLVDEFDSQLTPNKDDITAKFGTKDLVKDTDYTVTLAGQKLTVSLTEAGIAKIAAGVPLANRDKATVDGTGEEATNTDAKPFIQVNVKGKINSTAKLIKDIENQTKIEFDNKKDGNKKPKSTPPSEKVKVFTGGRKFKKIEKGTNKALAGAEFDLLDKNDQPVLWTDDLIAANLAKGANADKFVNVAAGQPVKFKSNAAGEFAIAGLPYGQEVTQYSAQGAVTGSATTAANRKYKIKETKAPAGYVINVNVIEFEVGPNVIDQGVAAISISGTPLNVENNKSPKIPNTGGIGSAIFAVAGIVTMGAAALGLKKRKQG